MSSPPRRRPRSLSHAVRPTKRLQRAGARHPESGAVIILALAFLTIILTLTVALFGLANAGAASLRHFRLERTRRYNADAAMQVMVQKLKDTPTLGVTTSPPACGLNYVMQEDTASGLAQRVVTPGSYLTVTCAATNGVTSGGADGDGGQAVRDVTIEVSCGGAAPAARGQLACGAGAANIIARARVRFDIDYGITPTAPDCGPSPACSASTVRAVVPKVVYWSIKG